MSTTMPNAQNITRKWYVIDAADKPLGRTAAAAHQQGVALRQGDDIEIRDHLATVHRHRRHCQPPPIRRKGQPQRGAVGDGEAPAQQLLH